ncbi:hypothetical protein BJ138DRAFT_1082521 [Hygrophoropsis aurantiaca]|uniref:Uncharacterized protein n=1 Tax=Hygrophoropsis aurantiaca TaxID=72124 RepID=A0ACB8AIK2_9AGAM|nr:hypothetical protein BJ138DRAFT_1082521 [Hygrophoropsis aurantiaca]
MLHHASRLLTSTTVSTLPLPSVSCPLTDILHTAAARAWTRRVYFHDAARPFKKRERITQLQAEPSSSCIRRQAPAHTVQIQHRVPAPFGVHPLNPASLSEHDTSWQDPGRTFSDNYQTYFQQPYLSIDFHPIQTLSFPPLTIPTSRESLYQNLLDIITYQPASLSTLLRYHSQNFTSFRTFHSTRSFNLLISLALRHAALGTAGRLFNQMRAEEIPGNLETWKLSVRWLVRTGRGQEAWRRVTRIMKNRNWKEVIGLSFHGQKGIPLPIWLEFLGSMKRGALRKPIKKHSRRAKQGWVNSSLTYRILLEPPGIHPTNPDIARHHTLVKYFPSLTSHEYAQLHPKTVYHIVHAMIRLGNRQNALQTTRNYFSSLPRRLTHNRRRAILDIIHLHIRADSNRSSLTHHFASRRVLYSLLDMRKDIRPSPTTLFLLLGTLRTCKRCATIAWQCLRIFRRRWGSSVESSMVRRRITRFALKEGRFDISSNMIKTEQEAQTTRMAWRTQRDLLGGSSPRAFPRLLQRPYQQLFGKRGAENRRWQMLRNKIIRTEKEAGSVI